MFNWFKNLFGKKEPQKNVEEIPENALVKEIKSKMNLIFHSYLHYAKEIQNLDSRFFINEICDTLNFYIIYEYGQKRIAHIDEFYPSFKTTMTKLGYETMSFDETEKEFSVKISW